jgi:hypothetical protein
LVTVVPVVPVVTKRVTGGVALLPTIPTGGVR